MSIVQEFKTFALKGNVIDLAVGVIIGAAFGKIVASFVDDLVMPLVGTLLVTTDFSNAFVVLGPVPEGTLATLAAHKAAGVPVLAYGNFITVALNFLILAGIIFLMVRQISRLKAAEPPAPAVESEDITLLRDIRDSLRQSR